MNVRQTRRSESPLSHQQPSFASVPFCYQCCNQISSLLHHGAAGLLAGKDLHKLLGIFRVLSTLDATSSLRSQLNNELVACLDASFPPQQHNHDRRYGSTSSMMLAAPQLILHPVLNRFSSSSIVLFSCLSLMLRLLGTSNSAIISTFQS